MGAIPIVKGIRLRATKINRCGLPLEGPGNRLVTSGFISVKLDPVMKERQELEQNNAEGKPFYADTTPATRKHHNAEIALCGVDPDLYAMFTAHERILDYDNKTAIGFADGPDVDNTTGVALEVWTGGVSEGDCPEPLDDDSVFSQLGSGVNHGYLLFGASEWTPSGLQVAASFADFMLKGVTIAMPQWGRGVYNVARTDAAGTPGRLLKPVGKKRHLTFFRTPVAPPEVTDGAVALAVQSIFEGKYFGASAIAVAPEQPSTTPPATQGPDADGLYPTPQAAGPDADGLYAPPGAAATADAAAATTAAKRK